MLSRLVLPTLLVLAGGAPSAALAQGCEAPPGTSAIEQYCERVPSAGTDSQGTRETKRESREALPPRTVRQLEQESGGEVVLGLPAAKGDDGAPPSGGAGTESAPAPKGGASSPDTSKTEIAAADSTSEPSNNPFEAAVAASGQGDGMGAMFGWLLVAAALGAAGLAWTQFRRRSSED